MTKRLNIKIIYLRNFILKSKNQNIRLFFICDESISIITCKVKMFFQLNQ